MERRYPRSPRLRAISLRRWGQADAGAADDDAGLGDEDGVQLRVQLPLLGQSLEAVVSGRLAARDGEVAFTPTAIRVAGLGRLDPAQENLLTDRFTFRVPLPELPAGVRLERVETRPGALVLQGVAFSPDTLAA